LGQAQQVLESTHRSPSGEHYERIDLTGIGPSGWEIGHLPIRGVVKHPPLAPALAAIHKLKPLSTPWVKRVGYTKILFWMLCMGCSSRSMPKGAGTSMANGWWSVDGTMLGRKIIEREEDSFIFLHAFAGLLKFGLITGNKLIQRLDLAQSTQNRKSWTI
jgi:hypothetical protein